MEIKMKRKKFEIPQTLLEIAGHFPEYASKGDHSDGIYSPRVKKSVMKAQKLLGQPVLADKEMVIVAILFERFLESEREVRATGIANRIYPESVERLLALKTMQKLIVKGVIDVRGIARRNKENDDSPESKYSLVKLADSEILFKEAFLQTLLGEEHLRERSAHKPFSNNHEYIKCWFAYIEALRDYRCVRAVDAFESADSCAEESIIAEAEDTLTKRSKLTNTRFPLDDFIEEEELDENERDIVLYLLKEELQNSRCTVDEILDFVSRDKFDKHTNRAYLEPHSRMISKGVIEISENKSFLMTIDEVRLAPDVCKRLLSQESNSDLDRITQILRGQNIFELQTPEQSFDDLILPKDMKGKLSTAITRYEKNVDATLREWGLERKTDNKRLCDKDEAPLLMLFSGVSGTGKTFAAGAFARQLNKDLLVTDISKVLSCYVGESEQNVRRIFYLFDRIVRRSDNPPVILLNECDQFLSVRSNSTKSVDKMYNQMQNLFLEGFEKMRGILIATTNLADNIDPAFSRRFHLKLEFPAPDYESRLNLWKKHLLPTIPLADDVNVPYLAVQYELTGGQIDLVVRNAAIEAAVDGLIVCMPNLVDACEMECAGVKCVVGGFKAVVGFAVN
jgi:AAA+ superfamily predicted ATPase